MVGEEGFEPPTLWSQTRCATKLRYSPRRCGLLPSTDAYITDICYQRKSFYDGFSIFQFVRTITIQSIPKCDEKHTNHYKQLTLQAHLIQIIP